MPPSLLNFLPADRAIRALIASTLAGSTSRGLFITISVIFFTRSVGLSPTEVGVGLTIAAVVSLAVGVPAGHLADRVGPRRITVTFGVIRSVTLLGYVAIGGFVGFVLVASMVAMLDAATGAARGALIAGAVPADERVRTRAYLRSVTNIGWAAGALGAGVALHYDTRSAYLTMIFVCALLSLLAAALTLRVPVVAVVPRAATGPQLMVLRDRPFLALAALNSVLCIHYGMLNVAVPLWVVERTNAPAAVVAVLALLNALVVIFFQVRASRDTGRVTGAAAAQRAAGLLLLGACLLYAFAAGQPAWIAATILVVAALVHVVGELRQAAGSWGIAFELAPAHAQGQYQGLYDTGFGLANVVAPALLATVVVGWGWPGWLLFGAAFAAAGAAVPITARWAQRTRAVPAPT